MRPVAAPVPGAEVLASAANVPQRDSGQPGAATGGDGAAHPRREPRRWAGRAADPWRPRSARLWFLPAVGDRQAAIAAEVARGDLRAGRVLAPLVLGVIHHRDHP